MTAPDPDDPLVCLTSRSNGGPITCGAPVSEHCSACLACTWALNATCACPPLPAVGTQAMPKPGTDLNQVPHTVVATWDHRRTGHPDDHVIVIQPSNEVEYFAGCGHPINTEHGAYLGLDDITVLDLPHIAFTAKEN